MEQKWRVERELGVLHWSEKGTVDDYSFALFGIVGSVRRWISEQWWCDCSTLLIIGHVFECSAYGECKVEVTWGWNWEMTWVEGGRSGMLRKKWLIDNNVIEDKLEWCWVWSYREIEEWKDGMTELIGVESDWDMGEIFVEVWMNWNWGNGVCALSALKMVMIWAEVG